MSVLSQLRQFWVAPWIPARYGKAPLFWLLSFVMFGWKFLYATPSSLEVGMVILSIILFLPVYLYSFWVSDWRAAVCIIFLTCLGLAWARFNFGGSSFIIFAAALCSRFPVPRNAYLALFLVLFVTALASYIFKFPSFFWIPALVFSLPSAIGAIVGENLNRANQKLFRNQEEIEHLAALAERERIARDLHDLLGHTLSVITLKAELAKKLFDRDSAACKQEILDIEQTARQALAEVRAAVLGYRATGLIHELANASNTLASAQVQLTSRVESDQLPAAVENVISLALREAVTNIIRHAQAKTCQLSISQDKLFVYFQIQNDGLPNNAKHLTLDQGHGLKGMRERVRSVGGEMQISTHNGMQIDIRIPLHSSN
ncbi:sensor histidine kinase [Undibacterium fentianense]|uniref:Sensor histidine kinase n=1 Tax=Undibacterium fentianense TaxID=2828728 RepID=A0A941IDK0_9BURK|nr:sensor histidine kinase [Undibacterium fentianense]MBR7801409.1 sensor histidine kinase [Undibacterium fentianense]